MVVVVMIRFSFMQIVALLAWDDHQNILAFRPVHGHHNNYLVPTISLTTIFAVPV